MSEDNIVSNPTKIKVVGIGGGGSNAITRMVREDIQGVEFIAMNTDGQALAHTEAPVHIQLGEKLSKGLGVGGDHAFGRKAAEETRDEIVKAVSGADMVFVTCGMGGGTGTGAAPVVADTARQSGALTIAIVTRPFSFEGTRRSRAADEGIASLLDKVDTLITIDNDRLLALCSRQTNVDEAFHLADGVLKHGVQVISELVTVPGLINLDFADVKAVMQDAGPAWMSIGVGSGTNRATDAAQQALASPLLDVSLEGTTGVLFNVVGGADLSLLEVNKAAEVIRAAIAPDAKIIFGVACDNQMEGQVSITLIATGFTSQTGMPQEKTKRDIAQLLKDTESEDEMDIPSFLRGHLLARRRQKTSQPKGGKSSDYV